MEHPETFIVTKEMGVRPAGPQDACFYCGEKLGHSHKPECVVRKRTVVVEARIRYVVTAPSSWDWDHVEGHRNEGSWCGDNVFAELESAFTKEREDTGEPCACDSVKFKVIREAGREDEARYHVPAILEED